MIHEIGRRTFLKRAGQLGGLVVAGGSLESLLAACGGNVQTNPTPTPAPGQTPIGHAGLKVPGVIQWGADFVDGAPYVFKDPKNPSNLIGFEVDIMQAVANLMGVTQRQVEVCYGQLDQALAANQFDFVFNGWEITDERLVKLAVADLYLALGDAHEIGNSLHDIHLKSNQVRGIFGVFKYIRSAIDKVSAPLDNTRNFESSMTYGRLSWGRSGCGIGLHISATGSQQGLKRSPGNHQTTELACAF